MVADALSHMCSEDAPGTVCAASEYAQHDRLEDLLVHLKSTTISIPVLVGVEAEGVSSACASV